MLLDQSSALSSFEIAQTNRIRKVFRIHMRQFQVRIEFFNFASKIYNKFLEPRAGIFLVLYSLNLFAFILKPLSVN